MKILVIYVDIRNSKNMDLDKKIKSYTALYNKLSSHRDVEWDDISNRSVIHVGDGTILTYNTNKINNPKTAIDIMKEIDGYIKEIEIQQDISIGAGISYGKAYDAGQKEIISPSIDGAESGSDKANKNIVKDQLWKWVFSYQVGDDEDGSLDELKDVIMNSGEINKHKTKKNIWFEFK